MSLYTSTLPAAMLDNLDTVARLRADIATLTHAGAWGGEGLVVGPPFLSSADTIGGAGGRCVQVQGTYVCPAAPVPPGICAQGLVQPPLGGAGDAVGVDRPLTRRRTSARSHCATTATGRPPDGLHCTPVMESGGVYRGLVCAAAASAGAANWMQLVDVATQASAPGTRYTLDGAPRETEQTMECVANASGMLLCSPNLAESSVPRATDVGAMDCRAVWEGAERLVHHGHVCGNLGGLPAEDALNLRADAMAEYARLGFTR